jgi:hypothetical protein
MFGRHGHENAARKRVRENASPKPDPAMDYYLKARENAKEAAIQKEIVLLEASMPDLTLISLASADALRSWVYG